MGNEASRSKERACKGCKQSLYGTAKDLCEHARMCGRLAKLDLVVPGLITGQAAIDVLQAAKNAKRPKRPGWS